MRLIKEDKGISLCIGDPTGNTLANKLNDVTWTSTEALAGTDGQYVIEFDEYYDDANGVLLGTKISDASTNGKVEIERAEGVKQYKAFMWNKVDGDGSMVPACKHISIDE